VVGDLLGHRASEDSDDVLPRLGLVGIVRGRHETVVVREVAPAAIQDVAEERVQLEAFEPGAIFPRLRPGRGVVRAQLDGERGEEAESFVVGVVPADTHPDTDHHLGQSLEAHREDQEREQDLRERPRRSCRAGPAGP
jgi:hypothetical protein